MFKNFGKVLTILLLAIFIIPVIQVEAKEDTITVNNQQELKDALANDEISTIILGQDIETTEKINIMRPVTIDGNHKTIRYTGTFGSSQSSDNTVWGGIYVLQVYRTSATIRNIKLTGGNAALLINGSTVKLEGTIDVSGNGFGGIELGKAINKGLYFDSNINIKTVIGKERKSNLNNIMELQKINEDFVSNLANYVSLGIIETLQAVNYRN